MKKTVLALFLLFVWNAFAQADVPKYISFQGELTDSQGTRITTSKSVTFKLHSAASGGAILWSEVQTLTPANGIVSASIGSATAGGVSLAFDTGYWLGVTVSPDAEMSPRIRLTTSPYAFIAKFLDTGAVAYGALSVAETVTAGKFVGNGAGLTGVSATAISPANLTAQISTDSITANAVTGAKLAGSLSARDSFVVGSDSLVVTTSGKIGIGTTSPLYRMDVVTNASNAPVIALQNSSISGRPAVRVIDDGGSVKGEMGYFNTSNPGNGAELAGALGLSGAGVTPIGLGTNGVRRVTIDGSTGNVGIGTSAPGDSLHVAGRIQMDTNAAASAADGAIRWSGSDFEGRKAGAWTSLTGVGAGGDITGVTAGSGFSGGAASGNATISLDTAYAHTWTGKQTFNAATTFSDSVIVSDTVLVVNKQSGNVGIGTTSPSQKFEVNGNVLVQNGGKYYGKTTGGNTRILVGSNGVGNGQVEIGDAAGSDWDAINFYVGSERMRITNTGNVGIGTTTPGGKLDVVGSVLVSDSLAVGDTRLVVLKSGNVGIGTAGPIRQLSITGAGASTVSGIGITNNEDAATEFGLFAIGSSHSTLGSGTAGDINFVLGKSGLSTIVTKENGNVGIGTLTSGGKLHVSGNVIVKDTFVVQDTAFIVNASGNVGIGTGSPSDPLHVLGTMRVMQANAAGTFVITSSGLVGIGTTAPATKMHVYEDGTGFPVRVDVDNTGNSVGAIVVRNTGTGALLDLRSGTTLGGATVKHIVDAAGNVGIGTSSLTDSLNIARGSLLVTNNSNNASLAVKNSGNVGIGTASPADSLHVAGTVRVSDSMTVGDTVFVVNSKSGNVGIGTANPGGLFDVQSGGASKFRVDNSGNLTYAGGNTFISMSNNRLMGSTGSTAVDAANRTLSDGTTGTSIDWVNRQLIGSNATSMALSWGNAAGNVGIGTTTPGDSLHVKGGVIADTLTVGDARLVVLKSGYVGIGTAAPATMLHVNGPTNAFLRAQDTTNNVYADFGSDDASFFIYGKTNHPMLFATNDAERVRIDNTGNVGIGTTSPGAKLHVAGNVIVKDTMTVGDTFLVVLASGRVGIGTASPDTDFSVNGGASKVGGGSWATFSDGRLKNIDGEFKAGTAALMKLNPVKYRYRADNPVGIKDGAEHVGLVAQEVKEAIPEAVESNNRGYLMLNNDPIIFAMLNAVKEQQGQIQKQQAENERQQAEIQTLKSELAAIKNQGH